MPEYLLDTDTCIYWLKGDDSIERKILDVGLNAVGVTVVTACELYFGAYRSSRVEVNLAVIDGLLDKIATVHTSPGVAAIYGKVKAHLYDNGKPIDDADLLIACIALNMGAVVVTNNAKHFKRIAGLSCENWAHG